MTVIYLSIVTVVSTAEDKESVDGSLALSYLLNGTALANDASATR